MESRNRLGSTAKTEETAAPTMAKMFQERHPDQKSIDPTQKQEKECPRKTTARDQTQSTANTTGYCGMSIKSEILP